MGARDEKVGSDQHLVEKNYVLNCEVVLYGCWSLLNCQLTKMYTIFTIA